MARQDRSVVIDGPNTVHSLFGVWPDARSQHDSQASDFLRMLAQWSSEQNELEIEAVFDGGYRALVGKQSLGGVRILFSEHDKADSIIIERVRALRYFQKRVTVVTWDQELAEHARHEEARIANPSQLLNAMKGGKPL